MNRFGAIEKPTNILRIKLPAGVELSNEDIREGSSTRSLHDLYGNESFLSNERVCESAQSSCTMGKHNCKVFFWKKNTSATFTGRKKAIDFTEETSVREALRDRSDHEQPHCKGPRPYQEMSLLKKIRRETTIRSSSVLCSAVYLFFWSVSDAILFYQENKENYRIEFARRYHYEKERCQNEQCAEQPEIHHTPLEDFQESDAYRLRSVSQLIETGLAPMVHGHAEADSHLFSQFNERILFFSSMSKLFTSADLKKIECMFKAGNIGAMLSSAKELCVGAQSNIMMQDLLRHLSSEQLLVFVHRLGYDIGPISATKYGAYVVQTILELAKCETMRSAIVEYFGSYAACLVTHPLGNYSIQTVGTFNPMFLRKVLLRNFSDIVKTHIGIRVLKKSLYVFSGAKKELLEALQSCSNPAKCDLLRQLERECMHSEEDKLLMYNRE